MEKIITIKNGTGTAELINDSYSVSADVLGYDNTSILPTNVDIISGTDNYNFTVAATGTLTLHVTDSGTSEGTPIVGATFIRTDSTGNEYGAVIITDSNGDAVFNNVPYADANAPIIYFKQTASDGDHEFDGSVQNTSLTTSSETNQIQNPVGALRTINLTDANYANLPIESASITLTN